MADPAIVDTDILIDAGRGISEAVRCLDRLELDGGLAVSVVTQMELVVGCRNKQELQALDSFLSRFEVIHLSDQISLRALELLTRYRLGHGLLNR